MKKDLNEKIDLIKKAYIDDLKSLREIGKMFGCSAIAIQKVMKRHGYDTSKEATLIQVFCNHCKKEFYKHRYRVRETDLNYCSVKCYQSFLKDQSKKSIMDRAGASRSRRRMEKYYGPLPEGSVVHHIDGNEKNCHITNLALLASQADHIRIHRNGFTLDRVNVLFDGSKFMGKEEILDRAKEQNKRIDKLLSDILSDFAKYKVDIMKGYIVSKPILLKERAALLKGEFALDISPKVADLEKESLSTNLYSIKVNGKDHVLNNDVLGYNGVIELAYGKKAWPNAVYSVTYTYPAKTDKRDGILFPGDFPISILSGMSFNAHITGNA